MNARLLALFVSGVVSSLANAEDTKTYVNPRFGFSLTYPSYMVAQPPPPNGDGRTFLSPDGELEIVAYGQFLVNQPFDALWQDALEKYGDALSYQVKKADWFVVSGVVDGREFYKKVYRLEGNIATLHLEYPHARNHIYDRVVKQVAKDFVPFLKGDYDRAPAQAEGNVSLKDIRPVLTSNEALAPLLQEQVELNQSGLAMPLGGDYGDVGRDWVGPYLFDARYRNRGATGWPLMVELTTSWHIEDSAGNRYGKEPPPASATGCRIVEELVEVKVTGNPHEETGILGSELGLFGELTENLEDDLEMLLGDAEPDPVEKRIQAIRNVYSGINQTELEWQTPSPPFANELGGGLERGRFAGTVRKVVLNFDNSEQGSSNLEAYYDAGGDLVFLFANRTSWTLTDGNTMKDHVSEYRFYFDEGDLIRALKMNYSFSNDPNRFDDEERAEARDQAENEAITVPETHSSSLYRWASELRSASGTRIVPVSEALSLLLDEL